jgi:hypothetical protein
MGRKRKKLYIGIATKGDSKRYKTNSWGIKGSQLRTICGSEEPRKSSITVCHSRREKAPVKSDQNAQRSPLENSPSFNGVTSCAVSRKTPRLNIHHIYFATNGSSCPKTVHELSSPLSDKLAGGASRWMPPLHTYAFAQCFRLLLRLKWLKAPGTEREIVTAGTILGAGCALGETTRN